MYDAYSLGNRRGNTTDSFHDMSITLLMASIYNVKTSIPCSSASKARYDANLVCKLETIRATCSKLASQPSTFDKVVIGFLIMSLVSSEVSVVSQPSRTMS